MELEYPQSNSIKHTLNIQIHHLRKRTVRMRVELLPPCRPCVRKQDIHMISCLAHFLDQFLHSFNVGAIRRHGDGFGAGPFVRQGVQRRAGFFAGGRFAGSDVDF